MQFKDIKSLYKVLKAAEMTAGINEKALCGNSSCHLSYLQPGDVLNNHDREAPGGISAHTMRW